MSLFPFSSGGGAILRREVKCDQLRTFTMATNRSFSRRRLVKGPGPEYSPGPCGWAPRPPGPGIPPGPAFLKFRRTSRCPPPPWCWDNPTPDTPPAQWWSNSPGTGQGALQGEAQPGMCPAVSPAASSAAEMPPTVWGPQGVSDDTVSGKHMSFPPSLSMNSVYTDAPGYGVFRASSSSRTGPPAGRWELTPRRPEHRHARPA